MSRMVGSLVAASMLFASGPALAAETVGAAAASSDDKPADVVIHEAAPPPRTVLVEWNPLSLVIIGRLSVNVVIAPVEHHAIVVTPYYGWANTAPIATWENSGESLLLPKQHFDAYGAELGYRYYFGRGGPRGVYVGPSLILSDVNVKPEEGSSTNFLNFGLAADVGYQMLVSDRFSIGLGVGVQYTATSKSIPDQQFPAEISANAGIRPRALFSLGWAF